MRGEIDSSSHVKRIGIHLLAPRIHTICHLRQHQYRDRIECLVQVPQGLLHRVILSRRKTACSFPNRSHIHTRRLICLRAPQHFQQRRRSRRQCSPMASLQSCCRRMHQEVDTTASSRSKGHANGQTTVPSATRKPRKRRQRINSHLYATPVRPRATAGYTRAMAGKRAKREEWAHSVRAQSQAANKAPPASPGRVWRENGLAGGGRQSRFRRCAGDGRTTCNWLRGCSRVRQRACALPSWPAEEPRREPHRHRN